MILVPGIMGSELIDREGRVVWGMSLGLLARQGILGKSVARIALPAGGEDDGVRATREIQLPAKLPLLTAIEPYSRLLARLQATTMRHEAVRVFPYDWRRSIVPAAEQLRGVAEAHLSAWRSTWERLPLVERRGLPEPRLTLVCHSMGGLVARWFAEVLGGSAIVRRIIALGTPFAGSLNALRILASGEYLPFGIFASAIRDTARTFAGVYELVARYGCVGNDAQRAIIPSDLTTVGADGLIAAEAAAVHDRLDGAVAGAGPARCPVRTLVGVGQPTLQTVVIAQGSASFSEHLGGVDHGGDGTVYRYSSALKGTAAMYLPQSHGSLAKTDEALAFVQSELTDRQLGEVQGVPGFGIRVPEIVRSRVPFDVICLGADAGGICSVRDAEDNRKIHTTSLLRRRDGMVAASVAVDRPGLYRVSVSGGTYSAVEQLVLALAEAYDTMAGR